jgi:Cu/Ag efflux pump CusA
MTKKKGSWVFVGILAAEIGVALWAAVSSLTGSNWVFVALPLALVGMVGTGTVMGMGAR